MEKDDNLLQLSRDDQKNNTRVLGISTTNSNKVAPRKSTSEEALLYALDYAKNEFGAETKMIKLRDLHFKHWKDTTQKMLMHAYFHVQFQRWIKMTR
jgi:hypothetical protein